MTKIANRPFENVAQFTYLVKTVKIKTGFRRNLRGN
jgi:hypothetical protein